MYIAIHTIYRHFAVVIKGDGVTQDDYNNNYIDLLRVDAFA